MSKITFRADDDLVARLEEYDTSKSEVMREALRAYFAETAGETDSAPADGTERPDGEATDSIDAYLHERIDTLVEDRLDALLADRLDGVGRTPQDINVNVTVDGQPRVADDEASDREGEARKTTAPDRRPAEEAGESRKQCNQCGEAVPASAVYCSNCGEKTSHRVFCDCGDELRSDWGFCPGCGRRTPAADVLDNP
ncbi:double zinc ribbon domain-containing protein [Halomarina litorea]|uniref:double zinc ribbon domain-containing protein n=1 Tax=Halomarina litorea TaxID=2961595 RepID=UPI0020C30107|nr:zinc ribbon domain-containing protein [Halomarina sp. BCD28]